VHSLPIELIEPESVPIGAEKSPVKVVLLLVLVLESLVHDEERLQQVDQGLVHHREHNLALHEVQVVEPLHYLLVQLFFVGNRRVGFAAFSQGPVHLQVETFLAVVPGKGEVAAV